MHDLCVLAHAHLNLCELECVCVTFHCLKVRSKVSLQFAAFSLEVKHKKRGSEHKIKHSELSRYKRQSQQT